MNEISYKLHVPGFAIRNQRIMDERSKSPRVPDTVRLREMQPSASLDSAEEQKMSLRIRWEFWKQMVVGGILGAFERQDN